MQYKCFQQQPFHLHALAGYYAVTASAAMPILQPHLGLRMEASVLPCCLYRVADSSETRCNADQGPLQTHKVTSFGFLIGAVMGAGPFLDSVCLCVREVHLYCFLLCCDVYGGPCVAST